MFQLIFDLINGIRSAVWVWLQTASTWAYNRMVNLLDCLFVARNFILWIGTAMLVVFGMFVDVADWAANAINSVTLTGINAPSGSIFAPTASFSQAYGFIDAIFPLHEMLSAILFLLPLWLVVNSIRIIKSLVGSVEIFGWRIGG